MRNNHNILKWVLLAVGILTACVALYFISKNLELSNNTDTKTIPEISQSCTAKYAAPLFKLVDTLLNRQSK